MAPSLARLVAHAYVSLCLLCFWLPRVGASQLPTVDKFAAVIKSLANEGMGSHEFQEHIDGLIFEEQSPSGDVLIRQVATSLRDKFRQRIEAANKLKTAIENLYERGPPKTPTYSDCCDINSGEVDIRFKQKVDKNTMCSTGVGLLGEEDKFMSSSVLQVMKDNAKAVPGLKWQYFSSEKGVTFTYPALQFCNKNFDPRFRPYYVELASPRPKDLVVMVDKSGSMKVHHNGRSLMDIAIDAATTVINTLNPNDRIGVVTFATSATTPPGTETKGSCYSDRLAQALPVNKAYLTSGFLQHVIAEGETYYSGAFIKAFGLFLNTPDLETDKRKRDKAIIFLTDGHPSDPSVQHIYETVRMENAKLGNKVTILTFGIGLAATSTLASTILTKLAKQDFLNQTAGEVQRGEFTAVTEPDNLRSKMASYYNYFGRTGERPVVAFSAPYYDAFGLGVIMSACLPVYHSNRLTGVACTDVSMSDLLSEVTFFRKGERSYAFLIDKQARALMHPILPQPAAVTENPIFLSISALERSPEAAAMITSMTSGASGHASFYSDYIVSRGISAYEGVTTTNILFHYFWEPVGTTPFSVCIVLAHQDRQAVVRWTTRYPSPFLYHRFDLDSEFTNLCNRFERIVVTGKSAVLFTKNAYVEPFEYLDTEETLIDLNSYRLYMTGATSSNAKLKEPVRDSVASTAKFEEIIMKRWAKYMLWVYIGTRHGVFRTMPGHRMPKNYDHTMRPWYKRAVSNRGLHTFSSPYEDGSGLGIILTLSQVILEGRLNGHKRDDVIEAVIGVDFLMTHLYSILLETVPLCNEADRRCFIVDNSGFIVVHKYFIEPPNGVTIPVQNQHITAMEPTIAKDLIMEGLLKNSTCVNFENFRNQFSWKLYLPSSVNGRVVKDAYTITDVPESNVFVIISAGSTARSAAACSCEQIPGSTELPKCVDNDQTCQCPCYKYVNQYDYCGGKVLVSRDKTSPCTPRPPKIQLQALSGIERDILHNLDNCVMHECGAKDTRLDCMSTVGCSWCKSSSDAAAHCNIPADCDRQPPAVGTTTTTPPPPSGRSVSTPPARNSSADLSTQAPTSAASGLPSKHIVTISIVTAVVVVLVVLIITVALTWRARRIRRGSDDGRGQDNLGITPDVAMRRYPPDAMYSTNAPHA